MGGSGIKWQTFDGNVSEDVEGSHGASIGKISEDVLLYMQSRGIPEEDITEIMAKSRIAAVAGRIPDEKTREMLLAE